ncbi:MAG: methionine--tRNA ligase, partial [Bacteroidales bacterium]|nr:methionine--tRNA ligase [Bacteroidales bacterium]
KLLKLKIDTGLDVRTIVSGIAEYYDPENLIGKQICIVANLEPRKIKGIESQGMILMAQDPKGGMKIVTPEEKVSNGSAVK